MKKYIWSSLLLLIAITSSAQRNPQTLIGDGAEFTSGFGGFMLQFPPIDGNLTALTGGGGAVLINNTFFIGGYGFGLADDVTITHGGNEYDLDHGHGGLYFGYSINPEGLVHLGLSTKIGWGEIAFRRKPVNDVNYSRIRDRIFVANPQVEVELNITEWFKFNFGVGYQITNGVDNFYYESKDFDGITYSASFLFGWFR